MTWIATEPPETTNVIPRQEYPGSHKPLIHTYIHTPTDLQRQYILHRPGLLPSSPAPIKYTLRSLHTQSTLPAGSTYCKSFDLVLACDPRGLQLPRERESQGKKQYFKRRPAERARLKGAAAAPKSNCANEPFNSFASSPCDRAALSPANPASPRSLPPQAHPQDIQPSAPLLSMLRSWA